MCVGGATGAEEGRPSQEVTQNGRWCFTAASQVHCQAQGGCWGGGLGQMDLSSSSTLQLSLLSDHLG